MSCRICENLEEVYKARLSEYVEARASAGYRASTRLAAQMNVEMERARYELEEHHSVCLSALRQPVRAQAPARLPVMEAAPMSLHPLAS